MDAHSRDLGLRRVSRLTRWSLGGALALTGAFSSLVAHVKPGHAKATTATTVTTPSDGVLQPPTAGPPASGRGSGLVTSGAS